MPLAVGGNSFDPAVLAPAGPAFLFRSRLEPMKKVAGMLLDHLENIVTFCRHRITNAVAEGLNSKIMAIKRRACGYRNKAHFKTVIYFFCGGLDLHPR